MNELYKAFRAANDGTEDLLGIPVPKIAARSMFTHSHAWAVPTDEALDVIARHAPIVEIGAGTGYWAALLKERGVDILAFDHRPPQASCPDKDATHKTRNDEFHEGHNFYHCGYGTYTEVLRGGVMRAKKHADRTLFLCWPPYAEAMAANALRAYGNAGGKTVIYVGESFGGCNANGAFFMLLEEKWLQVTRIEIPQWWGIHDAMLIYRRRA